MSEIKHSNRTEGLRYSLRRASETENEKRGGQEERRGIKRLIGVNPFCRPASLINEGILKYKFERFSLCAPTRRVSEMHLKNSNRLKNSSVFINIY